MARHTSQGDGCTIARGAWPVQLKIFGWWVAVATLAASHIAPTHRHGTFERCSTRTVRCKHANIQTFSQKNKNLQTHLCLKNINCRRIGTNINPPFIFPKIQKAENQMPSPSQILPAKFAFSMKGECPRCQVRNSHQGAGVFEGHESASFLFGRCSDHEGCSSRIHC